MRDTQQDKLNRLLNVLNMYESQRKAALSKGIEFKSPSKSKILDDAELNKNYFNQSTDAELLARVDAIAKAPAVKSKTEAKAEKAIEQNETIQKMLDELRSELEKLLVKNGELTNQIQAKDELIKQMQSVQISDRSAQNPKGNKQNNVTSFATIKGGKDDE